MTSLQYHYCMALADFPQIQRNTSLAGFSTFGVGGAADYFYALKDLSILESLLTAARAEQVPVFVLGGGSNTLFAEGGFRGLVLRVMAEAVRLDGDTLVVDAAAKWPRVLQAVEQAGLKGFEAMAGLPGTVGGAVAGNAGCFGVEMQNLLVKADLCDLEGHSQTVGPDFFQFRYRWSRLKETPAVVLRAHLKGSSVPAAAPTAQEILALRHTKQPPGKTGGSFFKNPSPEQSAGWLIDQCGLKGFRIGGAQISPKHGNFFMNVGGATTNDLLALRDHAQKAVQEKFGILLHEEVVIVF